MKADPESLGPEEYLWRQLKKRGLTAEQKIHQEFNKKLSYLNVLPKYFKARENIKAMFLSLINDIQFV